MIKINVRTFIFVSLLSLVGSAGFSAEPQANGDALLKTDLLNVFAHPDDETGMATTLAHYALVENKRVVNVYCTRGEGGGNMVTRHWGPSLGILRESELRACLSELGVERVYFLNQRDWAYTESAQMTLEAWDRETVLENLVRIVRLCRPEVMVTMNPAPNPGQHGHHQAAGILAIEAFRLAADPAAFPDQIRDEGLEPWRTRKIYVTGSPEPYGATISSTASLPDGGNVAQVAGRALGNHRSQGFGRMADSPWLARPRTYQLLKSHVGLAAGETSLFDRIDQAMSPAVSTVEPRIVPLWFEGSTAVERARKWSHVQQVEALANDLPSEISITAGSSGIVRIHRIADAHFSWESLRTEAPQGWLVERISNQTNSGILELEVSVPDRGISDGILRAIVDVGTEPADAEMKIKVVPSADSHLTKSAPQIGPIILEHWADAEVIEIPSANVWQGSADNDQDLSATCRIQHDDEFLFVLVEVTDDHVVSNIASDDVRGHWRSDSVEICIDPLVRSEHTLKSFKVGVFPFTTDGKPNAARDADANQGPISRTAPGMKLASEKTTTGYRIATAIPWSAMTRRIEHGASIGFNVLIYDGDKVDAAIGENINECRLAWSPGTGVQGRPGYWGVLKVN